MLNFKSGNLFNYLDEVEAIVNTVNIVGVMGKGIALEFKNRYYDNFITYKEMCEKKQIDIGNSYVHKINNDTNSENKTQYIVNFPTKKHWKNPSKLEYIDKGLDNLVDIIKEYNLKSIAMPALGCGNGNLNWDDVKPLIISKLEPYQEVNFIIIEPSQNNNKTQKTTKPRLTADRKRLLLLMEYYNKNTNGPLITHVEINILSYFLNYTNPKLNFKLTRNGPYLNDLKNLIVAMNPHYINTIQNETSNNGTEIRVLINKVYKKADILSDPEYLRVITLIDNFTNYKDLLVLSVTHWFKFIEEVEQDDLLKKTNDWFESYNHQINSNIIIKSINRIEKVYTNNENLSLDL